MPVSKLITQTTMAGILTAVAVVIERFVMLNVKPFEICFGFFIILLFPLLLDFRIATIAAVVSTTLTELLISGEGTFWINIVGIVFAFPIIKLFMLFEKRYMYGVGLVLSMALYLFVTSIAMLWFKGKAFEVMYIASKSIQVTVAIIFAMILYYPIHKLLPSQTENTWEYELCCEECELSINDTQECCSDDCVDKPNKTGK